jgi:Sugar (and other) transporter
VKSQVHTLLLANVDGKIDNPLQHLTTVELFDRVDARLRRWGFAKSAEMGDVHMWRRAARCAADPDNSVYAVPDLTAGERRVLRKEESPKTSFWDETNVRVPLGLCCLAAMVQGVTQSSANAANLWFPEALGMQDTNGDWIGGDGTRWLFNAVNAAPLLCGALFGCWLSDPLNDFLYGRRGAIFIAALLTLVSVIGAAFARNKWVLLGFRILLGLGMGAKASVVPIYAGKFDSSYRLANHDAAEVSPPKLRGRLVVNWQVFDALGIAFAFTLNLVFARDPDTGWRLMFAEGLLPTLPLLALVFAVPESPRFLMKRGLYAEAYRSLLRLRGHPIRAAKEMFLLDAQLEAAEAHLMRRRHKAKDVEKLQERFHSDKGTSVDGSGGDYDDEYDELFDVETEKKPSDPDDDEPDSDPSGFWARLNAWWLRMWKGGEPIKGQTDPFVELFRETTYGTRLWSLVSHPRVARSSEFCTRYFIC